MYLQGKKMRYLVERQVAEATDFRLYTCKGEDDGQIYILQIATEGNNGGLDRAGFVLSELTRGSETLEEEHARKVPDQKLNYDRLFPRLIDTFISPEQGNRRVNILGLKDVRSVYDMVPLSALRDRDHLRISLETSAWMMGRLLKLFTFTHPRGFSIPNLNGSNILVDLKEHYLVVFDWTRVLTHDGETPVLNCSRDIANSAKAIFTALGGDLASRSYPYDLENRQGEYIELIKDLMNNNDGSAKGAHAYFYSVVHSLFGKQFIPSKLLPIQTMMKGI